MNNIVLDVELYIIPQDCFVSFHLPMKELKSKLQLLCGDNSIVGNVLVVDCNSKYGIDIEEKENVLMLNNLLLKVNKLSDTKKEKFLNLLSINDNKNLVTLLTIYHDIDNYEIIPTKKYKTQNELYQVIGGLWALALIPDVAITLDGYELLTNEYKETCFWNAMRSGSIKYKNGNFYVPNHEVVKRPTNIDYDLIQEIDNYL